MLLSSLCYVGLVVHNIKSTVKSLPTGFYGYTAYSIRSNEGTEIASIPMMEEGRQMLPDYVEFVAVAFMGGYFYENSVSLVTVVCGLESDGKWLRDAHAHNPNSPTKY